MLNEKYEFRWFRDSKDKAARLQYKHNYTNLVLDGNGGGGGMVPGTSGWIDVPVNDEFKQPDISEVEFIDSVRRMIMDGMAGLAKDHSYWKGWPGTFAFADGALKVLLEKGLLVQPEEYKRNQEEKYTDWFAYFDEVISPVVLSFTSVGAPNELEVRRIWDELRRAVLNRSQFVFPVSVVSIKAKDAQIPSNMLSGGVQDCSQVSTTAVSGNIDTGGVSTEHLPPAKDLVIDSKVSGIKFVETGTLVEPEITVDMCDHGHRFTKLKDHPLKDGRPRCVYCLAIGFDRLKI